MRHPHLASATGSALVVVDVQEKLFRFVAEQDRLIDRIGKLMKLSRILRIPIVLTQQYTNGLGPTIEPLLPLLDGVEPLEKVAFSCFGAEGFEPRLQQLGARTLILCGIEAHICVQQTALDGLHRGYTVHLVSDAVSSRAEGNCRAGIEKMRQAGAIISTWEMVSYELMERAGTAAFREALPLFK